MMQNYELILIYFIGCPGIEPLKQALKKEQLSYQEIVQGDLPPHHPHKSLTSPSLVLNGQLVWGEFLSGPSCGCSYSPFSPETIVREVKKLLAHSK